MPSRIFRNVMSAIIAILGVALLIVNIVLYFAVVRPVRRIARHRRRGQPRQHPTAGEFPAAAARSSRNLATLLQSHAHEPRQGAEDAGELDAARDVFVSYSVPDRECAFELVERLEARGMSVWIAPRDISPGR